MRRARVAIRVQDVERHNPIHALTIQLENMSYTLKHASHHTKQVEETNDASYSP